MNHYKDYQQIKFEINIFFDGILWRYEPLLQIKLEKTIPIFPPKNFHLFKPLVLLLPFLQQEVKPGFFYVYHDEIIGFFNLCTHIRVPLDLDDNRFFNVLGNIVCKVHGAQFCPKTGCVISGPARSPLFKIKIKNLSPENILTIEGFYRENFLQ
jgi:nitrite reductase/ring-hydroxylating ferredoxin subunit